MAVYLRSRYLLGLALSSLLLVPACTKAPPEVAPEEIEGSALLKNFDARQDLHSSPATIKDFIAKLGKPHSVKAGDNSVKVSWYYRRFNHQDRLGEHVIYEAEFDQDGVFLGRDGKKSGSINLTAYLNQNLTPQERGMPDPAGPPKPVAKVPTHVLGADRYQRVSLEEFFGGELATPALSFEIPKIYVRAGDYTPLQPGWSGNPRPVSPWMRPAGVATAVASHHLPPTGDFVVGQEPPEVVEELLPQNGKFQGEEHLDELISSIHATLLDRKRMELAGHPIFAYLLRSYDGMHSGILLIGTRGKLAVIMIAYRAPATDDEATVRSTWEHITTSLR